MYLLAHRFARKVTLGIKGIARIEGAPLSAIDQALLITAFLERGCLCLLAVFTSRSLGGEHG